MMIWLFLRITGFLAYFYFTWAVIAGFLRKSNVPKKRKNLLFHMHTNAGWYGLFALTAHFLLVAADTYVNFPLLTLIVPFSTQDRSLYLSLGIIASYLFIIVLFTSDVYLTTMHRTLWKWLHFLTVPAWLLALSHSLGIGSDTFRPIILGFYMITSLSVLFALGYRINKRKMNTNSKGE